MTADLDAPQVDALRRRCARAPPATWLSSIPPPPKPLPCICRWTSCRAFAVAAGYHRSAGPS